MQTARALGSWGSTSWPSKSRDAYAKGLLARVRSLLPGRGGLWECLDIKPHKGCPQSRREGYRTPGLLHPQPPREEPSFIGAWENLQAWVPEPKVGSPAQPGMDKREAGHWAPCSAAGSLVAWTRSLGHLLHPCASYHHTTLRYLCLACSLGARLKHPIASLTFPLRH